VVEVCVLERGLERDHVVGDPLRGELLADGRVG